MQHLSPFSSLKRRVIALFIITLLYVTGMAQDDWITHYEHSGFAATSGYAATIDYCQHLAEASDSIHYRSLGLSPQGRDIPLLIIDRDGLAQPEAIREAGRAIVLIQAGIHAGEIDGKDAGLMFLRDLAIYGQHKEVLENISILFIPIFNVDGHERSGPFNRINQKGPEEMGWRTTAQNLNLNRDHLKVDAPEMRDWLIFFNEWLPDFFVDIHVTDGADYQYFSTYEVETLGNMDPGLSEWVGDTFARDFEQEMANAGFPVFPYVRFRRWHDPRSGLIKSPAPPRLSHGYTALQNRAGLLVENHSLKDYKSRVSCTYEQLKVIFGILNRDAGQLIALNRTADERTASQNFRATPYPLTFQPMGDSTMVEFHGVEYDIIESDLTGGDWFVYHPDRPATYNLPFFFKQKPADEVSLPEAYIVPREQMDVIDRLKIHGIQFKEMTAGDSVTVETYRFDQPDFARSPYEGRFRVSANYNAGTEKFYFPEGSIIIPMNQRRARIIAHLLEPKGPDSFLKWGFFNGIFEQKEYAETYVMEPLAREMIANDAVLREEFEKKRAEEPDFAASQWAQTNWFFSRTEYWDNRKNLYPVYRITDTQTLMDLMSNSH